MRVLLINHFPLEGSGSGVYAANLAAGLKKMGHEVKVIFPTNRFINQKMYKFAVRPVYFSSGNSETDIDSCLKFNFPCFTTHPLSHKTFYDLSAEEEKEYRTTFEQVISEEIEVFRPDVIHCGHIWILPAIASKFDLPLIVTAHGTDLIGYQKSEHFRNDALTAAKKAKKIITISDKNKALVEECFPFAKNKTVLIPNGYNDEIFYQEKIDRDSFLQEFGINQHFEKMVCFAGKFTHFKGIDILLQAAQKFENENTCTIIAGFGETFDEMQALAKKLELKNVNFIGNQPHDVLRKMYNVTDVSLVPSRNEAFGLVVIEAMACGAPVIGTNDGGIKDIITEETGILISPEDPDGLAEAVKEILSNTKKFDRKKIALYAKKHYSNENFMEELVEIYQK